MKTFHVRLKKERLFNNLTQQQLADLLGIPISSYQNYERLGKGQREPDYEMLVKIAKTLNTTIDYLLGTNN